MIYTTRLEYTGLMLNAMLVLMMLTFLMPVRNATGQTEALTVEGPLQSLNGFSSYKINSPYQGRATCVEVLTPDELGCVHAVSSFVSSAS